MGALFVTVAITLGFYAAPPVRQTQAPSASTDGILIGMVHLVEGEWFVDDGSSARRPVRAGDELKRGSRLIPGVFTGGLDSRSIKLRLYDGTEPFFRCSVPSTCDGPIVLSLKSAAYVEIFRSLIRWLETSKVKPMIIGQAHPGGLIELKEGQVELHDFARELAHYSAAKSASHVLWCASEQNAPDVPPLDLPDDNDCRQIGSVKWTQSKGAITLRRAAAEPGLYTLRLAADKPSTLDTSSFILAVESAKYRQFRRAYSVAVESPLFSNLSSDERTRAQLVMLQVMSQSVER